MTPGVAVELPADPGAGLGVGGGNTDPGAPAPPEATTGGGPPGDPRPPFRGGGGGGGGDGDGAGQSRPGRRRPKVVLYTALVVAVLAAVLVALLASSKPVSQGAASSPLIGRPAPPVSGAAVSGSNRYSLAQYAGRWVLVNFAASWCIPCRQETPQLLAFAQEHAAPGDAVVLTVAFDSTDEASLAGFLKSSQATWPAVDDPQAEVDYGVTGIPESYLVAPDGVVAAKFIGGVTARQVDSVIDRTKAAG